MIPDEIIEHTVVHLREGTVARSYLDRTGMVKMRPPVVPIYSYLSLDLDLLDPTATISLITVYRKCHYGEPDEIVLEYEGNTCTLELVEP